MPNELICLQFILWMYVSTQVVYNFPHSVLINEKTTLSMKRRKKSENDKVVWYNGFVTLAERQGWEKNWVGNKRKNSLFQQTDYVYCLFYVKVFMEDFLLCKSLFSCARSMELIHNMLKN